MSTFNLPELGEGLEEGEIVSWQVNEGDTVQADQTLVEVMTDKATIEVPSPASGKVKKLHHKVGDVARVGEPLVDLEQDGAQPSKKEEPKKEEAKEEKQSVEARGQEEAEEEGKRAVAKASVASAPKREATTGSVTSTEKVLASPAVRKQAREMGVDLGAIQGSGDRGRVLRKDLEGAGRGGTALRSISREERRPFVGIRRKIAERLSQSMYTAVHFTHHDEADFSEVIRLRKEANEYAEKNNLSRVTFLPFYIKAAIAGLKKYPILNSSLDTDKNEIVIKHEYHFGISVQTDNGLMVAVLRDCDRKNIFEISADLREVVERAREGKATTADLTGSTITITNVGSIGGLHATPVINYPETAILGMFEIKKRPVVRTVNGEEQIVARPMMYTNVTCDHRIIDGAVAAQFLKLVCEYLENPARMAFY